jgi:hypothetical protein
MRYARLVRIELALTLRQMVPDRAARRLVLAAIVVVIVSLTTVTAIGAQRGRRAPLTPRSAVPVFAMMIGLAVAAGLAGASRVQERQAAGTPWRIAPVPATAAAFVPLTPIALMCAAAVSVVAFPVASAALAKNDHTLSIAMSMAVVAARSGCAAAVWLVSDVRRRFGADAARNIGRALPGPISLAAMFGSRLLTPYSSTPAATLVVGGIAILLPLIALRAARSWMQALGTGWSEFTGAEPSWGAPGWWRLLMQRTPFVWGLAGVLPLSFAPAPAGLIALRTAAVVLPALALTHLMRWEDICPDRTALAPDARRHVARMVMAIGAPLLAVSAIVIAASAATAIQAAWLASLAILSAATVWVHPLAARRAAQFLLTAAAIVFGSAP